MSFCLSCLRRSCARHLRLVLSIVSLAALAGCGGSSETEAPPAQVAVAPAPAPVAPPPAPVAAQPEPPPPPEPAYTPPPPPPPKVERPADVAQWKPEDYRSAKAEDDYRMIDAVNKLAVAKVGDEETAKLFIELIRYEPAPPPAPEPAAAPAAEPAAVPGAAPGATPGSPAPTDPAAAAPTTPGAVAAPGAAAPPAGTDPAAATPPSTPTPPAAAPPAPTPPPPPAPPPTPPKPANQTLVTACVEGLAMNKTKLADGALRELLQEKIPTGISPRVLCEAIVRGLAAHPSSGHGAILLAAVIEPTKLRPEAPATPATTSSGIPVDTYTADQLREAAFREVRGVNSPALRKQLAERYVAPAADDKFRELVRPLLVEQRPENLGAQVILFTDGKLEPDQRQQLLTYFAGQATQAFDRLIGIPADFKPRNRPGGGLPGGLPPGLMNYGVPGTAEMTDDGAALVVQQLWQPKLLDVLRREATGHLLSGKAQPQDVAPLLLFGMSTPLPIVRQQLAAYVKSLSDEGTQDVAFGGSFGTYVHDPGMLIVVKQMPRKEDPAKVQERSGKTDPRRPGRPYTPPAPANPAAGKARAPFEWMQASEDFVSILMERFYAAAKNPKRKTALLDVPGGRDALLLAEADRLSEYQSTGDPLLNQLLARCQSDDAGACAAADEEPADKPEDDSFGTAAAAAAKEEDAPADPDLGLSFHTEEEPLARYRLNWPTDLKNKLGSIKPGTLVINYVRFEETSRPISVATHYLRQLKGAKTRLLENGRWVDFLGAGSAARRMRSVDVMVTSRTAAPGTPPPPAADQAAKQKNAPEDIVVEILSIEIPNPSPEPQKPKPAAKPDEAAAGGATKPSATKPDAAKPDADEKP